MLEIEIKTDNLKNSRDLDDVISKFYSFINSLELDKEKVMEFDDLLGEILGQTMIDYTYEGFISGVNFAKR